MSPARGRGDRQTVPEDDGLGTLIEDMIALFRAMSRELGEHAGPECRACPICQMLAVARRLRPETFEQVAELGAALAAVIQDLGASASARPSAAAAAAEPHASGEAETGTPPDPRAEASAGFGESSNSHPSLTAAEEVHSVQWVEISD